MASPPLLLIKPPIVYNLEQIFAFKSSISSNALGIVLFKMYHHPADHTYPSTAGDMFDAHYQRVYGSQAQWPSGSEPVIDGYTVRAPPASQNYRGRVPDGPVIPPRDLCMSEPDVQAHTNDNSYPKYGNQRAVYSTRNYSHTHTNPSIPPNDMLSAAERSAKAANVTGEDIWPSPSYQSPPSAVAQAQPHIPFPYGTVPASHVAAVQYGLPYHCLLVVACYTVGTGYY